jgi:putative heme-binding domain-containing protein
MDQLYKTRYSTSFGMLLCLSVAAVAFGQALPDGKGKAEFERTCTTCHTVAMSTRLNKSHDEWVGIVNDMVSRGAQGSQADLDNVVLYLTTNFGPSKGGAAVSTSVNVAASAAVPIQATPAIALSSSEIDRAKRVIQANGCTGCHRVGSEGSYLGPNLNSVGTRQKPEGIRASILSPPSTVLPENRQVRMVTRGGKTIMGKILNQDGYSVQMVDSSGQLATYSKASLREFTIVDKNTMPSFENKISDQDLEDLVRYMSSLTEPGK